MKIKCLYDTGEVLTSYRRKRLYVSNNTEYGLLEIGREYLVMGMMLNDGFLSYLIDDSGLISVFPSELFKVTDNRLPNDWFFDFLRLPNNENVEATWGYQELVDDKTHYEKLVEGDEGAHRVYFRRKIELESFFSSQQ